MHKYRHTFLVIVFLLMTVSMRSQVSLSTLKAVMTYQLAGYITWENEEQIKNFKIGVFGNDEDVYHELKQISLRNKIKGRSVEVVKISNLDNLKKINILFVPKQSVSKVETIWGRIEKKKILLITDSALDKKFIMLNLVENSNTTNLNFEINRANLIIEGFSINPELLLLGGTEIDIRELYREMRQSLILEKNRVKEQQALLLGQTEEIKDQLKKLDAQKHKLELLNKNMALLENEIKEGQKELSQLSDSIFSNNEILDFKSQQIAIQEDNLKLQKKQYSTQLLELQKQKKAIRLNKKELDSLVQESQDQKVVISHQQQVLSSKDTVIKSQEKNLYFSVFIGLTLLVIGGSVYKAYYDKKKANHTLEQAVEARTKELSTTNNSLKNQIDEKELVQAKLIESEKNYKEIYNTTADSIVIYGEESRQILNVNDAFYSMFGYRKIDQINQLKFQKLFSFQIGKTFKPIHSNLEEVSSFEVKAISKGGKLFWVDVTLNQTHINNNTCVMAVIRDISKRKKVELELKDYRDNLEVLVKDRTVELEDSKNLAESANKAKSSFLSNMSHELRTPLNAILGYAQILQIEHNITKKQKENLSTIYTSGAHLLALINEILDFGKVESGKMEIKQVKFPLDQLLQNVVNIIKVKAGEKQLYLNFEKAANLPQIVFGDEQKIRQILLNLLSNAVKYNNEGGVTFVIKKKPNTNVLVFEVIDTGIGIQEDKKEDIFEAFVQVSSNQRFIEGTGLGLPITKKLVYLLGGEIFVESEVGKGSVFTVELPIVIVSGKPLKKDVYDEITGYQGKSKKVLIIDDNESNSSLLRDVLEPKGFNIEQAKTGVDGIKKFKETQPDVILLDFLLPDINGIEVANSVKKAKPNALIIGISATRTGSLGNQTFIDLCDEFILKPIDLKELYESIQRVVGIEWNLKKVRNDDSLLPNQTVPNKEVLIKLSEYAYIGDFNQIEVTIENLNEDILYTIFCEKIRNLMRKYDSDGIVKYLKEHL